MEKLFPIVIAVLFLSASATYIAYGEYGKAVYFFASFLTSFSVAFLI